MITHARARRLVLALVLALLLVAAPSAAQTARLTILHFNDDYQLTAVDGGKAGGMDRLATLVKRYRAQEQPTLLLFAGDLISPSVESSIFKGAQLIDGLNLLGVDVATLGNHEFDFGPDVLRDRLAASSVEWVASNTFTAGLRPFPGTRHFLVKTVGDLTIGFIGLLTLDTATSSSPGATSFGDPVVVARALIPILRARGAQVIIAVTHLHMHEDQQLLRMVPEIDLVIGGHEHDPLTATVGGRLIAKAGSDAKWLGVTRLALDGSRRATHELIVVDEKIPSDAPMAALVKRYTDQMSKELDVVIGTTTVPLDARNTSVRAQESALGNYITDVMRAATQSDLAITNGGGIRTNALFPAGPIARKDVFGWLPFGNVVAKVAIPGSAVRAALENGVSQVEAGGGRFPQVSGLRYTFNPTRPAGSRLVEVRVGDQPISDTTMYTVATNDFMLRGGDGYAMFTSGQVLISAAGGPLMVTAVMEAIERARTISPRVEGRITIVR